MMRRIFAVALLCFALPVFAGSSLSNQDVVEMVKLGLGQQVISAKIDASGNHFDTSPKALAQLKHQGVSTAVISKMIEATSSQGSSSPVRGNSSERGKTFEFVGADGTHTELSPVRVTAEMSYRKAWIPFHASGPETFMFIQGRHASLHTSASPEFITSMDPLNVRLIHLGQKKDREARYVVFSGSTTDREVQVDNKDLGNGNYSIKPIKPLEPGEEYAFLVISDMPAGYGFWAYFAQNAAAARAYDFAVN
ncbi:MAG: hypothetical protein ABI386_07765 [Rhodanobacter sp.]